MSTPTPTPRRRRRRVIAIVGGVVGALVLFPVVAALVFVAVVPAPVDGFEPEAWTPGPATEFSDDLTLVADPAPFSQESVHGPEDIVLDDQGRVYTGDRDGVIWRWNAQGGEAEVFAETGGRPLGLVLAPDGRLLVANHGLGLQAIETDGTVRTLLDEVAGEPILFANDLDVAPDGVVYLSDSSSRYNTTTLGEDFSSYLLPDALDGRASGRLISYDLDSGEAAVLLDELYFPNGVALTPDGDALWVLESNRYRILTYDLVSGATSTVIEDLPGTPDNIDADEHGRLLVAIYDRTPALDTLVLPHTPVRHLFIRLPTDLFVNEDDPLSGSVIVADPDGTVQQVVTGLTPAATSVYPAAERWYLGALLGQPVRWTEAP